MYAQAPPASQPSYSTQIELSFECKDVIKMDLLSKSDPMVVVYCGSPENASPPMPPMNPRGTPGFTWREVFRTEIIKNNANPVFNKTFKMMYRFEQVQPLRFVVIDADNETRSIADDDLVGETITTLGQIAGSAGQKYMAQLRLPGKSASRGAVIVRMHEVGDENASSDVVHFKLRGIKLAKKDLFSSDPYFILKRFSPQSNEWVHIYRSETIMKNLNPKWNAFSLPLSRLRGSPASTAMDGSSSSSSAASARLMLEVFDYDALSADDFIGTVETNLDELLNRVNLTLVDPKKKKSTGMVQIDQCLIEHNYSFLDYISRGCEVSLVVAVDWTGSNGAPNDPRSLHYWDPSGQKMNQYEQVIRAIGGMLGYYDRDQLFPAYGFGGRMRQSGNVSHCFALNGNAQNPLCTGVDGILYAYKQALANVDLYGPTHFNEVITLAARMAQNASVEQSGQSQKYTILLIITDGVINDMEKTCDAIVRASNLPMSIVIVGVGNADFAGMNFLDGDDGRLRSRAGVAARDIVQFVPFNRYVNSYQDLSRETLAEIPKQLTDYFKSKKLKPMGM